MKRQLIRASSPHLSSKPRMGAVRTGRTRFLVAVVMAVAAFALTSAAYAQPQKGNPPVYLALGDSYPYGSSCVANPCNTNDDALFAADNDNWYVGYPVYLQQAIDLPLINAACGGDVTDSFLNYPNTTTGRMCRRVKETRPDMLHVDYSLYTTTWAQMDYAENYLTVHSDTVRLITLQLGGPETTAFFAQTCKWDPTCILAGLPNHIAGLTARLDEILRRIRAKYAGPIIVVEYPSTNYSVPFFPGILVRIYDALRQLVEAYNDPNVQVAPVFNAFMAAAAPWAGDSCVAGLLQQRADGCNIHPTAAGHQLIANVIAEMPIVSALK